MRRAYITNYSYERNIRAKIIAIYTSTCKLLWSWNSNRFSTILSISHGIGFPFVLSSCSCSELLWHTNCFHMQANTWLRKWFDFIYFNVDCRLLIFTHSHMCFHPCSIFSSFDGKHQNKYEYIFKCVGTLGAFWYSKNIFWHVFVHIIFLYVCENQSRMLRFNYG